MPDERALVIVGVDPGREKCGVAAVSTAGILHRHICPAERLVVDVAEVCARFQPSVIVIGNGTNGPKLAQALRKHPGLPQVEAVCERNSTLHARQLYFSEHPPKGLRKLLPKGLLVPPEPIDDFAAALLALRYLEQLQTAD